MTKSISKNKIKKKKNSHAFNNFPLLLHFTTLVIEIYKYKYKYVHMQVKINDFLTANIRSPSVLMFRSLALTLSNICVTLDDGWNSYFAVFLPHSNNKNKKKTANKNKTTTIKIFLNDSFGCLKVTLDMICFCIVCWTKLNSQQESTYCHAILK